MKGESENILIEWDGQKFNKESGTLWNSLIGTHVLSKFPIGKDLIVANYVPPVGG